MPRPSPNRSSRPGSGRPAPKGRPARPSARPSRPARPGRPPASAGRPGRPDSRGPKWDNRPSRPSGPGGKPDARSGARSSARPGKKPGGSSAPRRPKPSDFKPKPERDPSLGIRLQRVMADAGIASRRECEEMIADGRVEVNDSIVTELPIFVNPATDRIKVDGQHLQRSDRTTKRVYVMLNKPDNTLGTTRDDLEYKKGGRRTVNDLVEHPSGARLYPVGRLDFHSTGLVLMTNDGELADRLTHARYGVSKTFRVWVNGSVRPDILDMLRRRIGKKDATDAEGRPTGGVRLVSDDEDRVIRRPVHHPNPPAQPAPPKRDLPSTVIEIQIREGKTDPLDEMLLSVGCRVRRIARTAIGPLRLMGVRPGEWRDLTKDELTSLKEAAGLMEARPVKQSHGRGRHANPLPAQAPEPSASDQAPATDPNTAERSTEEPA